MEDSTASYTLEDVACNLCGSRDTKTFYSKPGPLTGEDFPLVQCRNCGLLYLNPRLTPDSLLRLYDENYYRAKGFDENVNYVEEYEGNYVKTDTDYHVRVLKQLVPPPAKLLDVGCGTGVLMKALEQQGYTVNGIEPSPFASKFAKEKGHNVQTGDFLSLDLPPDRYDAVLALEVIEHVYDPGRFLRRARQTLRSGGLFYYTTGNFKGFPLQRKLFGRAVLDSYVTPEGHIYFFSNATMKRYFRESGFSEVFYARSCGAPRESLQLSNLFRKLGLFRQDSMRNESAFARMAYRSILTVLDPVIRPRLPMARK